MDSNKDGSRLLVDLVILVRFDEGSRFHLESIKPLLEELVPSEENHGTKSNVNKV